MRTIPSEATEPIVAYRWFQVGVSGVLSGAQDVEWPDDEPMRAGHIGALEDGGRVLRVLLVVVGAAAAVCALALVAGVALLVEMLVSGSGTVLGRVGAAMDIVGAGWGLVITLLIEALAPHPGPGPGHRCPGPAPRLAGRWTPSCGIYAYGDVAGAAQGTRGAWVTACPLVLARVVLWGTVYVHRSGYRAELARIEGLYDDGSGHVELPAARYRVPTEPYPADIDRLPAAGTWAARRFVPRRLTPGASRCQP